MSKSDVHAVREEASDSPTAWFVVLERARESCNFALAARAQRELERLGVKVSYAPAAGMARAKGVAHAR